MSHQTIDYEEIIRSAGHRVTRQREAILDAVCEGGGHTTLGQIYMRAHHADPSLDRSTVYRTLNLFVSLGLVVSADLGSVETFYEIAHPSPHHHLICKRCGATVDIADETVSLLAKAIRERYGFAMQMDHLVLAGVCKACRQP
jgi:Fur family ferric uptake transcriptional regulator